MPEILGNKQEKGQIEGRLVAEAEPNSIANHKFLEVVDGRKEVRFVHATSSKFRSEIRKCGLKRPKVEEMIDLLFERFKIPVSLHIEIRERIDHVCFGLNSRLSFVGTPIYCMPLHRDFSPAVRAYARNYADGGEFEFICIREINRVLESSGLLPVSYLKFEPEIIIIKYFAEEICTPLFDPEFVDHFQVCLSNFREGNFDEPLAEVRIYSDIENFRLGPFLSIEEYRAYVGSTF